MCSTLLISENHLGKICGFVSIGENIGYYKIIYTVQVGSLKMAFNRETEVACGSASNAFCELADGGGHLFVSKDFMNDAMAVLAEIARAAEMFLQLIDGTSSATEKEQEDGATVLGKGACLAKAIIDKCEYELIEFTSRINVRRCVLLHIFNNAHCGVDAWHFCKLT